MTREEIVDDLVRIRLYHMADDSRDELLEWIAKSMYEDYEDIDEKSLKLELSCYKVGDLNDILS